MTCSLAKLCISVEPCSMLHCSTVNIASILQYLLLNIALFTVCGGNEITQSVFMVTLALCTVHIAQCTVHIAHWCTPSCKLYKLYTALTFSQCALHLSVYTLHWSQIVFMVTLALLTRARYSQKLDHGDLDQMTLGGNRTNIVCMNCEL